MVTSENKDLELVNLFANAICSGDISLIAELLSDSGEFTVFESNGEIILARKQAFLNWFIPILESRDLSYSDRLTYYLDKCNYCIVGNPVIIIEDGKFPVDSGNPWQKEKLGLMIEIKGGKIDGVSFCGTFKCTINQYNEKLV